MNGLNSIFAAAIALLYNLPDAVAANWDLLMGRFGKILAVVAVLYVALAGGLLWAMYQPPAKFGRIMRHVPAPAYVILPFKQLWFVAREGNLRVGDEAPDFSLPTADHKERVQLSSFRGQKPVVLVFGSYT